MDSGDDVSTDGKPGQRRQACEEASNRSLVRSKGRGKTSKEARDAKTRWPLRFLLPQPRRVTLSDNERREAGLIQVLDTFTLDLTPLIFLPQRLGRSAVLDTATDALIRFPTQLTLDNEEAGLRRDAFKSYSRALRLIHDSLEQLQTRALQTCEPFEDLVGAIMILSFVDIISIHVGWDKGTFGSFTHWNGVTSLLVSSPSSFAGSDIARSSVDHGGLCNYIIPVFLGRPSPFEDPAWLDADPASLRTQPLELAQLGRMSHRLFIRLPRLICHVRALRSKSSRDLYAKACKLVHELLLLQDDIAENWLLHHVNVKATILDERTKKLVSHSYVFRSCSEMEAGLQYWHARLTVLQLYSTLLDLSTFATARFEASRNDIAEQKRRCIVNILMSWQYGKASGYAATAQFNVPLVAIWAAVRGYDGFRGCDVTTLADWIIDTHSQCYCGWIVGNSLADLNAAADVLAGGALDGPLVQLMRDSVLPSKHIERQSDVG